MMQFVIKGTPAEIMETISKMAPRCTLCNSDNEIEYAQNTLCRDCWSAENNSGLE